MVESRNARRALRSDQHANAMQVSASLSVAYVIQNVGIDPTVEEVGDAIPVRYTLNGLQKAGHEVTLLMLKGRTVAVFDDALRSKGSRPAPLGLSQTRPFMTAESAIRRLQRELGLPYFAFFDSYRFYEAGLRCLPRYTLCHEHNGLFSAGAALACRRLGLPYVLTFSADPLFESDLVGRPLQGIHARMAARTARITYQVADRILCVSKPAAQHLAEVWGVDPEKIVVMPNGVDVEMFATTDEAVPVRTELGLGDAPVIGFVGGFQPWHGLEQLVESFARVLEEYPEARLLLVGDGPVRPQIEQKAGDLGIGAKVIITGLVPQARVPAMLAVADIAVLPYPRLPKELWFSPLKLYEYMAAGKAIVASRAGQIAEVVKDGCNGVLVESGNVSELSQAVLALLRNRVERERLGRNARQQAVERHSWEQYIRRLEQVYVSALAARQQKLSRK